MENQTQTTTQRCPFEEQGFAAAYALDALDGDELRAFSAHLPGCPICPAEVAALRATVAQLPFALDDAAPSVALRERFLGAVAAEAQAAPRQEREPARPAPAPLFARRQWARAYAAAAIVLLTLSLGLLGWNVNLQRQVRDARLERDAARATLQTWQLASTTSQPASGRVLYLPEHQQAILIVNGLPPLQPGQVYQVWLIQNGQPQGAGVLQVASGETAMRADLTRYQTVAITIEPGPSGSPAPTSQPILVGNLGQQ